MFTEGDGSGDSCESSGEEEVVHKPKPLQARRSILDAGDISIKQSEEPPAKRAKREDTAVSQCGTDEFLRGGIFVKMHKT